MMSAPPFDFDDEFASPASWAALYRACGWQVIPAHMPSDGQWKRPLLASWLDLQDTLVGAGVFARWYDPEKGDYRGHKNMGAITGSASGGLVVIDLDAKPGGHAQEWWAGLIAVHNSNIEPDTPRQRTGGGGEQIFFRAKDGWRPPTFKAPPMAIDVRGQGGFVMLPPSRHASGKSYDWEPGYAPWEVEVAEVPDWLVEAIETLRLEHGGQDPAERRLAVESGETKNAFGLDIDGREEKLLAAVWGAVVDLYRESPVLPSLEAQGEEIDRLWTHYEQTTKSRLDGPQFEGMSNADRLEKEGRGRSELVRKWTYAMRGWDMKVKAAAAQPRPNPQPTWEVRDNTWGDKLNDALDPDEFDTESPPSRMALVTPFHGQAPDRQWLVNDWIVEGAVNSLYGAGGTGKSLVALQLGTAVSLGQRWLGMPTKPGPVFYVSCEDDEDELHRRTDDIKLAMGFALGWPFPDFHAVDRVGQENRLAVSGRNSNIEPGPFLQELEAEVTALKPSLLILDTLADVYAANEIDRGQVNYFLKTILGGLIARQQPHVLTIVLIGHPSVSGVADGRGYSGSGAWEAGVRSRIYLGQPDGCPPDERMLTRGKANYASSGDDTGVRLTWADGVFRAERELADGDPELLRIKARVTGEVWRAWEAKSPYTQQRGHRLFIFKALLKLLVDEGFERTSVRQAIRELIEDGRIGSDKRGGRAGLKVFD